jgi:hypothetical protein
MRPDQLERRLRERLGALGPARRAELLHVLMLPDLERRPTDRGVLELPTKPRLRRAADRLRGGPDAASGAGRMLREADAKAAWSSTPCRSIRIPLARSITALRPNALSRLWY